MKTYKSRNKGCNKSRRKGHHKGHNKGCNKSRRKGHNKGRNCSTKHRKHVGGVFFGDSNTRSNTINDYLKARSKSVTENVTVKEEQTLLNNMKKEPRKYIQKVIERIRERKKKNQDTHDLDYLFELLTYEPPASNKILDMYLDGLKYELSHSNVYSYKKNDALKIIKDNLEEYMPEIQRRAADKTYEWHGVFDTLRKELDSNNERNFFGESRENM